MSRRLRAIALLALMGLMPLAVAAQEATPETGTTGTNDAALTLLVSIRSDLELLANSQLGSERPTGWSGSLDTRDPQLAILMRLDLELLAARLSGIETRPPGWFGAVASTPLAVARDIRHDLELLADTVIQPGVRPPGWTGGDPLMRCARAAQTLVSLLEREGYRLQANPAAPDFCQQAEVETSQYVERNLLAGSGALLVVGGGAGGAAASGMVTVNSDIAVAFLDRNARESAGTIPPGTPVTPVARSYTEFSNMMVVRGEGFEVFLDYTTTTMDEAGFEALPDVNITPITISCAADWCEGAG